MASKFGGSVSRIKQKGVVLRSVRRGKTERVTKTQMRISQLEFLRRVYLKRGDEEKVQEVALELAKLRAKTRRTKKVKATDRKRNPTTTVTTESVGRSRLEPVEVELAPRVAVRRQAPEPVPDMTINVYLDTDDAVTALKVVKATQRIANELGYATPEITEVRRGSFLASFIAAWKGAKGQKARAVSLTKAKEIAQAGEQYGLLFVQDKQADVDQKNVSSAVELMNAYAEVPNVAVKVGAILFLKYVGPNNQPVVITRTLSTREMAAYDKTPSICSDPSKLEENLAMLVAQDEEDDDGPLAIGQ